MSNTPGPQASIGNGQTINADAAVYWLLLVAAVAAKVGVWVVPTEGTRTYARQLYLWTNRNRPGFNPAWHPDDARAYHLSGRAVDVGSHVGFVLHVVSIAFYSLAGAYGFRATVPGEPWHFEWRLEWVAPHIRFIAAVNVAAGTTPTPLEDDMTPEQDRKLTYVYEVLQASGPDNGGIPLVKQIGGAFRDSAAALAQAKAAAIDAYETRKLVKRLTDDAPDNGDSASIPRLSRRLGTLLRDLAQPRK